MEYILFSGGFDSSCWLLECILVKNIEVTPLVLTFKELDSGDISSFKRENHMYEKSAREEIYKFIKEQDESISKLLHDEIIIDSLELDEEIKQQGILAVQNKILKREIKQIHYFGQLCKNMGVTASCLATYDDFNDGGGDYSGVSDAVVDEYGNFSEELLPDGIKFIKYFKIPYYNTTKKEMLSFAKNHNYSDILYRTWSCFFPVANKPCRNCEMCKMRIIEADVHDIAYLI